MIAYWPQWAVLAFIILHIVVGLLREGECMAHGQRTSLTITGIVAVFVLWGGLFLLLLAGGFFSGMMS
ncbi:MAG TPA: hypothetical protein VKT73_12865 [Xanthobacteraceae bacterium]|nr:hypothetical protein [Xanthobacteraceae bacterium]